MARKEKSKPTYQCTKCKEIWSIEEDLLLDRKDKHCPFCGVGKVQTVRR